jgi:hypothetical protein
MHLAQYEKVHLALVRYQDFVDFIAKQHAAIQAEIDKASSFTRGFEKAELAFNMINNWYHLDSYGPADSNSASACLLSFLPEAVQGFAIPEVVTCFSEVVVSIQLFVDDYNGLVKILRKSQQHRYTPEQKELQAQLEVAYDRLFNQTRGKLDAAMKKITDKFSQAKQQFLYQLMHNPPINAVAVSIKSVGRIIAEGRLDSYPCFTDPDFATGWDSVTLILPGCDPDCRLSPSLYGSNQTGYVLDPAELECLQADWRASGSGGRLREELPKESIKLDTKYPTAVYLKAHAKSDEGFAFPNFAKTVKLWFAPGKADWGGKLCHSGIAMYNAAMGLWQMQLRSYFQGIFSNGEIIGKFKVAALEADPQKVTVPGGWLVKHKLNELLVKKRKPKSQPIMGLLIREESMYYPLDAYDFREQYIAILRENPGFDLFLYHHLAEGHCLRRVANQAAITLLQHPEGRRFEDVFNAAKPHGAAEGLHESRVQRQDLLFNTQTRLKRTLVYFNMRLIELHPLPKIDQPLVQQLQAKIDSVLRGAEIAMTSDIIHLFERWKKPLSHSVLKEFKQAVTTVHDDAQQWAADSVAASGGGIGPAAPSLGGGGCKH